MSKEENLKKNLISGKRRATRVVVFGEASRNDLRKLALEKTLEAKAKPKPKPKEKTSKVLDDLIAFLVQSDLEAEPEHIVEGAMRALQSGILGGNFIAPTESTVMHRVKCQLKVLAADREGSKKSAVGADAGEGGNSPGDWIEAVPERKEADGASENPMNGIPF